MTTTGSRHSSLGKKRFRSTKNSAARSATGPTRSPNASISTASLTRRASASARTRHLKTTEDMADSRYQRMGGRYDHAATLAAEATSFIRPEILALSDKKLHEYSESKQLKDYKLQLERLVRYKPHTLTLRRRKAARHAKRNGRRRRPRLSPTHRCRPQIRHVQERKGRVRRTLALIILELPPLAQSCCPSRRRSTSTTPNSKATKTRSPPRTPAPCRRTSTTPRPAITPAPAKVRSSTTMCRSPCTTISSRRPRQAPRDLQVLRSPPQEDAAPRSTPLRHLRADPQRARHQAHLEASRRRRRSRARTVRRRLLPRPARRPRRPLVRSLSEPGQTQRRLSAPAPTTAGRTFS